MTLTIEDTRVYVDESILEDEETPLICERRIISESGIPHYPCTNEADYFVFKACGCTGLRCEDCILEVSSHPGGARCNSKKCANKWVVYKPIYISTTPIRR